LIQPLLYDGPNSLCEQAQHSHKAKLGVHGDGGGLGWYGAPEEPAVYRDSGPAWADPNLRELTRVVESQVFFAHVRASTGAPNVVINCHPFRSGKFLFMHNGQIGGFEKLRRQLLGMLSDEAFTAMVGGTDSELLFQLMLTNGLRENPVHAIQSTITLVDALRRRNNIKTAFRATIAITDGQTIWALRWSSDSHVPSLFLHHDAHGALAVSEPVDEDISRWNVVPENSLLCLAFGSGRVVANSHAGFISQAGQEL
jgi:glutamine amidotransferase